MTELSAEELIVLKNTAQMAIDVGHACILSGVVISFADVVRKIPSNKGTAWKNNHPINVMFLQTQMNIVGLFFDDAMRYSHAYNWCKDVVNGKIQTWDYVSEDLKG